MTKPLRDITGLKFNYLTVVRKMNYKQGTSWIWECQCDCSNLVYLQAGALTRPIGPTKSCGCLRAYEASERVKIRNTKHNMSKTSEYWAWYDMIRRCYNSNTSNYTNYGGRGIWVCRRWRWSFENFYKDMGPKPEPTNLYSLDRYPDNNDGYKPDNCRWATIVEQNSNRRSKYYLTHNNITKSLEEWARNTGIPINTLRYRTKQNWPSDRILRQPIHYD